MESTSALHHLERTHPRTAGPSFQAPSPRCTRCSPRRNEKVRNLVVCIDGTCNKSGPNRTNVRKLFEHIEKKSANLEQHALYFGGIGTDEKLYLTPDGTQVQRPIDLSGTNSVDKLPCWTAGRNQLNILIARNADKAVKEAYHWLAAQYQEGDQLYLFGFSRGAYQVRVLAGVIHEIGLMKGATEEQVERAYDCYEAIRQGKPMAKQNAREFKDTFFSQDVKVHFVGVWDTVSSVGPIRKDVFLSMSLSAEHACHFRHALALDECRVKFMPELLHDVNSQTGIRKSGYSAAPCVTEEGSNPYQSTLSDDSTNPSKSRKKGADVKEVWFAGSHSDVGGKSKPGEFRNAGNISLLWMRREASANGLLLLPTDMIWLPDDLNLGICDSMTPFWRAVEYLPIKHQVSFSGAGEDARRLHRLRPRCIIPGQKIHASILYANAYQPKAALGGGFDIPTMHSGIDDMELDDQIWETGLFDETSAQVLLASLGSRSGVAPIYLDRLLFLLQSEEGKQSFRNIPDWEDELIKLVENPNCLPLIKLVTIIAYYETFCDHEAHQNTCVPLANRLPQDIFDRAEQSMSAILTTHNQDGPSVAALLRPLTKHPILRERILTQDVLDTLMRLLDRSIKKSRGCSGQAMDGLNYLLRCKDTRQFLIDKFTANSPNSNVSRLSRILEVDDLPLLAAALRMVLTLACISEGKWRAVCSLVKPRIRELARKNGRLVGPLAMEILLVLDDPNDCDQLNIRDTRVRANLTGVLIRLYLSRHGSMYDRGCSGDPGQQMLRHMFGIGTTNLTAQHREHIGELKMAVEKGNVWERASATVTLLTLCETSTIRAHLRDDKSDLLGVFVNQLQCKRTALLAAYALATCLKYCDMESITDNKDLPRRIVGMLRLDYFDSAVGQIEGFRVFEELMRHANLREKIKSQRVAEVLTKKLGKNESKQPRTSLICLRILQTYDLDYINVIIDNGLERLRNLNRGSWEAGANILSAMALTDYGVTAIKPRIHEIVEMLLPKNYQLIPLSPPCDVLPSLELSRRMMGPTHTLCILAQNETLRNHMRGTMQYNCVKILYNESGTFVGRTHAWPWQATVINMLDEMFKAVEQSR